MSFEPIFCPKCKKEINFKCLAIVDEDVPQIQGVSYLMKCSTCDHQFMTGFRKGEKISEEQLESLMEKEEKQVNQAG